MRFSEDTRGFIKKECFEAHAFPWSMDMEPREALLSGDVLQAVDLKAHARRAYEKDDPGNPKASWRRSDRKPEERDLLSES